MRSAYEVSVELGLVAANADVKSKPHTIRTDVFEKTDWQTLVGDGSIRRMLLSHGQVDDSFIGSEAEGVEAVPAEQRDDAFIDMYVADLTIPTIGRKIGRASCRERV